MFDFFSAVIEYTNRVLYLEDNDVAAVTTNGGTCRVGNLDIC